MKPRSLTCNCPISASQSARRRYSAVRKVSTLLISLVAACLLAILSPAYAGSMPGWVEVPVVVDGQLSEGTPVSGRITNTKTAQLYSVDVSEVGVLTVEISASSGGSGSLQILDSDGKAILSQQAFSAERPSATTGASLLAGRYYVCVQRSQGEYDFRISMTFSPVASADLETNDTFLEAAEAELDKPAGGCLGFQGNGYVDKSDWWVVEVDNTGLLKIGLQVSSETARGSLRLLDASGTNQLTSVSLDGSNSRQVSLEYHVAPSTFYVEVQRSQGEFEYTVTPSLQAVPVDADKEPNDYHTAAINISPGTTATGAVGHFADGWLDTEDWWVVRPSGSGTVIVSLSMAGQSAGTGYLYVYSSDWMDYKYDTLNSSSGKRNASVTLQPRKDVAYYIRVQRENGAWSYSLNTTFAPAQVDAHPSESASAIEVPGKVSDQIDASQTERWYKVTIPGNGKLELTFTTDRDPGSYFRLYDTNARRELASEWVPSKTTTTISKDLGPGTYYVQIAKWYNSTEFSYMVSASFQPAVWDVDPEPNDLPSMAADLPLNGTTTGHLGYLTGGTDDIYDWYKVDVDQDGLLTIGLETTGASRAYLTLFDCNGSTELDDEWVASSLEASVQYNVSPGTYYVRLWRYDSSNVTSYRLTSKLTPALYASDPEPNDSVTQAMYLGVKSSTEGHIGYYSNRYTDVSDWYYIDVAQNGLLTVKLECTAANPQSYLRLFDVNGVTEIASKWMGGDKEASISANLTPGRYYVQVLAYYSGYRYSYKLTSTLVPAELESDREFNNHRETATDIPINGIVTGDIGYQRNGHVDAADWYRVSMPYEGTLVASFAMTANPGSYLYAYDADGKQIGSVWIPSSEKNAEIKLANLVPGTYYLAVTTYSSVPPAYSYVLTTTAYRESDGPSVVGTFPGDGSQSNVRSLIVVPLSGDIDKSSVPADALTVTDASGSTVSGEIMYLEHTVVFYPDQKLSDKERYSATLVGTIKDKKGKTLGGDTTFTFTSTPKEVIEVPAPAPPTSRKEDSLAGYAEGRLVGATVTTSSAKGARTVELAVEAATVGPLNMLRVSVSKLQGMDEVVAYKLDDSSAVAISDPSLYATSSGDVTISFLNAAGEVVESAVISAQTGVVALDFTVAEATKPRKEQRITGSVGVAKLGLLFTVRVTINEVTGIDGATRFRVDDGAPAEIGGSVILATLNDEFTLSILNESGETLLSERLPAESNPELVLVYGVKAELPPNHVLVGDTAIAIDLFFDQPEEASLRVNEALATASDISVLVYIEGSDITDAFTGQPADEVQIESMRERLRYVVDSSNEKTEI